MSKCSKINFSLSFNHQNNVWPSATEARDTVPGTIYWNCFLPFPSKTPSLRRSKAQTDSRTVLLWGLSPAVS